MKPEWHVMTTLFGFLVLDLFFGLELPILFYALMLTLGIDLVDHMLSLFTINHRMRRIVLPLIFRGHLIKAYRFYASRRFEYNSMLLHRWIFFFLWIALSLYLKSVVIFLGLVLHYSLDVYDSWRHGVIWRGLFKQV